MKHMKQLWICFRDVIIVGVRIKERQCVTFEACYSKRSITKENRESAMQTASSTYKIAKKKPVIN